MSSQRILVTGFGGFLGRHIVSVAARDPRFSEIELVDWRTVGGDLLLKSDHQQSLASGEFDGLLHLAWLSTSAASYEWKPDNFVWAETTISLAMACADAGLWFVGLGSGLEHDATAELTPYLEAKRSTFSSIGQGIDDSAFTWLRPFWVLSIPDKRPRVLSQALAAKAEGIPFTLREPGQLLDFIEVRDVASGILTVVRSGVRGPQDVGTGKLRRVDDVVSIAVGNARPSLGSGYFPKNSYAAARIDRLTALGWLPSYTSALFGN